MQSRIKNFPVSFMSVTLGLIGFALAWQKAESILKINFSISGYLLGVSLFSLVIFLLVYFIKVILYWVEVKEEFLHPIKINFYPIIAKIFLIAAIIFLGIDLTVSKYFWWAGVAAQTFFMFLIMSFWIRREIEIKYANPSWFIPVVGCMIIPIAGISHFSPQLSWFFFSVGFFWWLILTIIVVNRIIFHQPLAEKMIPTLFILFAPPVIGFIALSKLVPSDEYFGGMLYFFGLFMFLLVALQYRIFSRIKFYLSWWAYSFPLAALSVGTFLMYHRNESLFFKTLSVVIFLLLNLMILFLSIKTIKAIKRKQICIEEE